MQQQTQDSRPEQDGNLTCAVDVVYAATAAEAAGVLTRALRTYRWVVGLAKSCLPPTISRGTSRRHRNMHSLALSMLGPEW